jgi:hypothetical protein
VLFPAFCVIMGRLRMPDREKDSAIESLVKHTDKALTTQGKYDLRGKLRGDTIKEW